MIDLTTDLLTVKSASGHHFAARVAKGRKSCKCKKAATSGRLVAA
jgi:hypothetical protein